MAKEWTKPFYNSKAWKAARASYIAQRMLVDGGMCEVCGIRAGFIVHHCEELTQENISDTSVSLDFDNLLYACKDCHDRFEGHFLNFHKKNSGNRVEFDSDGQPLPPYSHL